MRLKLQLLSGLLIGAVVFAAGVSINVGQSPSPELNPIAADDKQATMILEVEIKKPENARGWHRPYVAIWLQDSKELPVRTIALWIQKDGQRWHPNLKKWWRDDRDRRQIDDTDILDGISGATKAVGSYKVAWDGLDDNGKPLKPGKYTLLIEAVREHGTYQIIKEPIEIGPESFKKELAGNVEIKIVKVDFRGIKGDGTK